MIDKMNKGEVAERAIKGVACDSDVVKITIRNVPDQPGIAAKIMNPLADAHISVDIIVQNVSRDNLTDYTFTLTEDCHEQATTIIQQVAKELGAELVDVDKNVAKVSVIGIGMLYHSGISAKTFRLLAENNINIQLISTSEIKITVVIQRDYIELATRVLHAGFSLDQED